MANRDIDPAIVQWQEMFSERCRVEWEHNRQLLEEIRRLVREQNTAVRRNSLAIASLKTWVALVGGLGGIGGLVAVILAWAMR